jgi:hypothetical protein
VNLFVDHWKTPGTIRIKNKSAERAKRLANASAAVLDVLLPFLFHSCHVLADFRVGLVRRRLFCVLHFVDTWMIPGMIRVE